MTYSDWHTKHIESLTALISSLPCDSIDDVIDHFSYENMRTHHPSHCPLYAEGIKCHDVQHLNCLFCACPHFQYSDTPLFVSPDGTKTMSICTIGSKQARRFTHDNVSHCDCSQCHIPHTVSHIRHLLSNVSTKDDLISLIKDS